MKINITLTVLSIILSALSVYPQAILQADGPGNTSELITSILAPGNDTSAVEDPQCIHPGRHIAEVWDTDLNQYVFEFYSHVTPDNDRCIMFDRQRIEIKTYDQSPDNLKGVIGETITYKWRFKLPTGFQPSTSFTHIHQIKPVGGNDGDPLFTLTPRKGSPNKLELIHNNTAKVKIVNLSLFEGVWVECTEVVYVDSISGTYSMNIKKVSDGTTLLSYSSINIMTIRSDNNFIRPKWGIYRSLDHPSDLRDEAMRFARFYIAEETTTMLPNAPTSLTATAVSASQINLTWTDNSSNEEQFRIERSPNGSTWSYLTTVSANSIAYFDTALTSSTIYYYHIRSENTFGNSSYSNSANDTTFGVPIKYTSTGNTALWSTQVWSPSGKPKAIDTVVAAHDMTLDADVSISQLNINSAVTLTITNAHNVYGNMLINGTLSVSNATTVTMNGNINCTGSTALLKFSSNNGHINNTGANRTFTLSNGATLTSSMNMNPLSGCVAGMTWVIDNSSSLTNIIIKSSGNTSIVNPPNSQIFGNLQLTCSTVSDNKTFALGANLSILGNFVLACANTGTLGPTTWDFGNYNITTTGTGKTVTVTQTISTVGAIIQGTGSSLLSGFSSYNFKPSSNANFKVIYGSASSQGVAPGTYQFLTISGEGTKSLSGNTIVSDSLILAGGKLLLGSYNLTLGPSAKVAGSFSASIMVVATGSGELRKEFSAIGSFTFPVGDTSGTAEYSPVTITINSASAFISAYVGVNLVDTVHPNNSSGTNFLSRYWKLTASGITNPNYNAAFTYADADINGTESLIYGGRINSLWTLLPQVNALTNAFTATGIKDFGDFTGGDRSALNLTALVEGLYNGSIMVPDTITIELHNGFSPYALAYQTKAVINSSGNGTADFFAVIDATNYYIVIKHRNSMETWSASAQSFSSGVMNYDFTIGSGQALGNNMTYKGSKWCIYSGDINHDGFIDLSDLLLIDNDVHDLVTGYTMTDVNGDGLINQSDLSIVNTKSLNFISKVVP